MGQRDRRLATASGAMLYEPQRAEPGIREQHSLTSTLP